jgi:hypothetical protein
MKRGSGDGRRGGGGGSGASVLKALDAFPKIADDFAARTASGGVVTLASLAVMALLFVGELGAWEGHVRGTGKRARARAAGIRSTRLPPIRSLTQAPSPSSRPRLPQASTSRPTP